MKGAEIDFRNLERCERILDLSEAGIDRLEVCIAQLADSAGNGGGGRVERRKAFIQFRETRIDIGEPCSQAGQALIQSRQARVLRRHAAFDVCEA